MPLESYTRGNVYWVRGRVEYNSIPISDYYRCSTGASSEAGAQKWIAEETDRVVRRHLLGKERAEKEELTFSAAVFLYGEKPKEAVYLIPIVEALGDRLVSSITPNEVRELAPKLYPNASTDTWVRQVITPIKAVINNAHGHGRCAAIRIAGYSKQDRIAQDRKRAKDSRVKRVPFTLEWVQAFVRAADPHNAALVEFIFETGARIDQAVSVVPSNVDIPGRQVWLKAQKGHEAQWVAISEAMAERLSKLPPKRPQNRKTGEYLEPRVFGYATGSGTRKSWARICKKASIKLLTPHAGRHGFYTHLRVRLGIDPITAAKAGRWSNAALPDARYAHASADEHAIRENFRTIPVQYETRQERKANKIRLRKD